MSLYCNRIIDAVQGEINIRGSKFIAYAYPVTQLAEISSHLCMLKREHYKARHHCYAYRLGALGEEWRANDDGEPSGSAGLPIYNQLQSFELSNTLVVVVRYFGGVLLGVPRLIRAYKQATENVLNLANYCRIVPRICFCVTLPYEDINRLMQIIEQYDISIIERAMDMICIYTLSCRRDDYDTVISLFERSNIHLYLHEY